MVSGPLPGTAAGDTLASLLRRPHARRAARPSPAGRARCAARSACSAPTREVRVLGLPGEPGRRPALLAKVLPARPVLVELTLG